MEPPQSPFISGSNNRERFNQIIQPDDDESVDDYQDYLPKNMSVNVEQQRKFADECMIKAGGFGRFQWIICTFIVIGADCSALITQCFQLLSLPPQYECQLLGSTDWTPCKPATFCTDGKPNGIAYRIDYSDPESLENWFVTLKMECEPQNRYALSLFHISLLIGLLLGAFIFPKLADVAGRRIVFYIGVFIHIIAVSTSLIVNNQSWFYGILFIVGIETSARFIVGYIYLSEFCLEKQRPMVTSIAMFFVAQSATICAVYFWFISKHWFYLQIIGLCLALVSFISLFVVPESPRWLISQEQYKNAIHVYKKIAKVNGHRFNQMIFKLSRQQSEDEMEKNMVRDPNTWIGVSLNNDDQFEQKPNIRNKEDKARGKPKLTDICFNGVMRKNFLILLLCWSCYMYCDYSFESFMSYTLGSIFVDIITAANAEGFAYLLSGFLYMKKGARPIITFSLMGAGVISGFMIVFQDHLVILAALVIGVKACIAMAVNAIYLLTFDSFAINYNATVFGVLIIFSRSVGVLGPMSASLNFPIPTLLFAIMCLVTGLITGLFYTERGRQ